MSNLLAGELSFSLDDGYTAVIGSEEKRVYDRIIESNVGVVAMIALEGKHLALHEACLTALTDVWA